MLENVYEGLKDWNVYEDLSAQKCYEGLNAPSEAYLSKEYFCKMYPTCVFLSCAKLFKSCQIRSKPNNKYDFETSRLV